MGPPWICSTPTPSLNIPGCRTWIYSQHLEMRWLSFPRAEPGTSCVHPPTEVSLPPALSPGPVWIPGCPCRSPRPGRPPASCHEARSGAGTDRTHSAPGAAAKAGRASLFFIPRQRGLPCLLGPLPHPQPFPGSQTPCPQLQPLQRLSPELPPGSPGLALPTPSPSPTPAPSMPPTPLPSSPRPLPVFPAPHPPHRRVPAAPGCD